MGYTFDPLLFSGLVPQSPPGTGVPTVPTAGSLPPTSTNGALFVTLDTGDVYEYRTSIPGYVIVAGPGVMLSIGPIDSQTPSINGAVDANNSLVLQSASATDPGLVNTAAQTIAGPKTFNNQILASDGAVSAPGVSFASEPSSGMYRAGTGDVGIGVLGTEVLDMQLSSPGLFPNLGIGNPASTSDIVPVSVTRTNAAPIISQLSNPSSAAGSGSKLEVVANAGQSFGVIGMFAPATTTPDAYAGGRMTVRASGTANGVSIIADNGGTAPNDVRIYSGGTSNADLGLTVNESLQTIFGGVQYNVDGTVSAPAVSFENNTNSGLYSSSPTDLSISINGVQVMDFQESTGGFGNVGMGGVASTNDQYQLLMQRDLPNILVADLSNTSMDPANGVQIILNADNANTTGQISQYSTGQTLDAYAGRFVFLPNNNSTGLTLHGGVGTPADVRIYNGGFDSAHRNWQWNTDFTAEIMQAIATPADAAAGSLKLYQNSSNLFCTIDSSGNISTLSGINTGDQTVTFNAVGSSPNANGATVTGNTTITLEPASASFPGILTAANYTSFSTASSLVTTPDAANTVLAGPTSGSSAAPTFRALVAADIPNLSATYLTQAELAQPSGVASLDSSGKIPVGQLPSVVMEYEGAWNPNTNSPALSDGTGTNGNVYYVTATRSAAVSGNTDPSMVNFQIGDLVIYSSTVGKWQLVTPAAGVSSVNGAQGAVTVNAINQLTGDVTAGPASGSQSDVATLVATSNATLTTLSSLSLPGSQVTGNIAGNAANITATSNSTLTTLSALSLPGTQVTGNISGNATNITATSNSTLTSLPSLSLPGTQVTGNISGNAANITATSNSTLTTLSSLSLPTTQLSGTLQAAQEPAHTGDVTNTAGSLALSLVATTNSTLTTLSSLALPASQITGTLPVNHGGTGQTTLTAHDVLIGNGTSGITQITPSTAGFVLTSNGTSADPSFQAPTSGSLGSQGVMTTFTTNGTFTTPSTSTTSTVYQYEMVGGGGGGGGANGTLAVGGGGGAGAYARGTFTGVAASTGVTITVGVAGSAGSTAGGGGGQGGTSSLGTPANTSTLGGVGGNGSTTSTSQTTSGGTGGTVAGGSPSVSMTGARGSNGYSVTGDGEGGMGAGSAWGSGGGGGGPFVGSGFPGTTFGAGGGGAYSTTASGGAGGGGVVIITQMTP